eukprot:1194973-Prorocentrum_minimum.AAC.5
MITGTATLTSRHVGLVPTPFPLVNLKTISLTQRLICARSQPLTVNRIGRLPQPTCRPSSPGGNRLASIHPLYFLLRPYSFQHTSGAGSADPFPTYRLRGDFSQSSVDIPRCTAVGWVGNPGPTEHLQFVLRCSLGRYLAAAAAV